MSIISKITVKVSSDFMHTNTLVVFRLVKDQLPDYVAKSKRTVQQVCHQ